MMAGSDWPADALGALPAAVLELSLCARGRRVPKRPAKLAARLDLRGQRGRKLRSRANRGMDARTTSNVELKYAVGGMQCCEAIHKPSKRTPARQRTSTEDADDHTQT